MSRESDIEAVVAARTMRVRPAVRSAARSRLGGISMFKRISAQDKSTFLSQLSMMLRARLPILRSLEILAGQTRNPRLRSAIGEMINDVRKGSSFSSALAHQAGIFDALVVVTAEVGQESGRLPEVLSSLAEYMERMNVLRRKVMQALAYPVLVLSVAALVVSFLLLYIVPTFADMFRTSNVPIPYATRVVITASSFFAANWVYVFALILMAVAASRWLLGSELKKSIVEQYALRIPWVGGVLVKNYTARFCRTLGTLLQSQVPLVDALSVTKRIFVNRQLRGEIERLIKFVKQGRAVAEPLSSSKIFSPVVAQMIAVGEETSELDTMLLRVAAFYEAELADTMETLTTVIEPILIVMLGAMVGTVLIAMYLPMFDMTNAVGGG